VTKKSKVEAWLAGLKDVYVRLAVTEHGVGVRAVRDIPKGTNPFATCGDSDFIEIPQKKIESIENKNILSMIQDFCPRQNGVYYVPQRGLNSIDVAWYLNHSNTPNMYTPKGDGDEFIALRDIKEGEYLTIDYDTYDDREEDFRKG
jgi:SET domain-containing protein